MIATILIVLSIPFVIVGFIYGLIENGLRCGKEIYYDLVRRFV
jgi:p-aminobenzoyl-glutamate transporter AbgT